MIDSRDYSTGTLHVLGFFDGTDLKSAAIFDHGVKIRDIKVSDTPGSQRVNFDFRVPNPSPAQVLVVVDDRGRMARAQLAPDAPSRGEPGPPPEPTENSRVEPGGERVAPMPPDAEPGNVAEIPARGGDDSMSDSGTHRRLSGGVGRLGDVKIHVISMTPVMSQPGSYEVTGQLAGPGIRRAGIYLDGRPIKPIPVTPGTFTSFDVIVPLVSGREATIRAYGAGNNFAEMVLEPVNAGTGPAPIPPYAYSYPYPRAPYGYNPPPYGYATPTTSVPWWRRFLP